jgi:hypothetical protein
VNANSEQHQFQAAAHDEEIGLREYWLPVRMIFRWRFAHRAALADSPAHHLHLSLSSSLILAGKFPGRASIAFRPVGSGEMGRCLIRVTPADFPLASSTVSD